MLLLPSGPSWHITRRTLLRGPHYRWKFTTTLLRNARMPRLYCPPELLLVNTESRSRQVPALFCVTEVPGTQIGPQFAALRILCRPSVHRRKTCYNT
jgi:hypothetical protein